MITYEMKDRVMTSFFAREMRFTINLNDEANNIDMSSDQFHAIVKQFDDYGFIEYEGFSGGAVISLKADFYDFYNHGGFTAQEELLKKNIEKLLLEIESLKPSMPDKINTITSIAGNIATALGLFFIKQ